MYGAIAIVTAILLFFIGFCKGKKQKIIVDSATQAVANV
jgi:hypothetical protein